MDDGWPAVVSRTKQFVLQCPHLDEFEADLFLLLFEIGNGLGNFGQLDEHTVQKIGHDAGLRASPVP